MQVYMILHLVDNDAWMSNNTVLSIVVAKGLVVYEALQSVQSIIYTQKDQEAIKLGLGCRLQWQIDQEQQWAWSRTI